MPKKADKITDFKSGIDTLTQLVDEMEKGSLTLEESLAHFEKGITLTKQCQKILQDAEQKVKILTEENGKETLTDFDDA